MRASHCQFSGRDHRHRENRKRESSRDHKPLPQRGRGVLRFNCLRNGDKRRKRCVVADGLDGCDQVRWRHHLRVVRNAGLFGGVVDRGVNAIELVELLFDAVGTRRAGHARHGQIDVRGRGIGHDAGSKPASSMAARSTSSSRSVPETTTSLVVRSTDTSVTPATAVSSEVTALTQWPQVMPGTE